MFDWVSVRNREDVRCPSGHKLDELQTKSHECSMCSILINEDVVSVKPSTYLGGGYGDYDIDDHGNGIIHIYSFCTECHPPVVDGVFRGYGELHAFRATPTTWWVVDLRPVPYEEVP